MCVYENVLINPCPYNSSYTQQYSALSSTERGAVIYEKTETRKKSLFSLHCAPRWCTCIQGDKLGDRRTSTLRKHIQGHALWINHHAFHGCQHGGRDILALQVQRHHFTRLRPGTGGGRAGCALRDDG